MKFLIQAFYHSITADKPVPIPYHEILRTARIMDDIFAQLSSAQRTAQPSFERELAKQHS